MYIVASKTSNITTVSAIEDFLTILFSRFDSQLNKLQQAFFPITNIG